MIVDTEQGKPDCVRLTREELEYLLAGFYASGYAVNTTEQEYAIIAVRERNNLHNVPPDEFYSTLHTILDRSKEL